MGREGKPTSPSQPGAEPRPASGQGVEGSGEASRTLLAPPSHPGPAALRPVLGAGGGGAKAKGLGCSSQAPGHPASPGTQGGPPRAAGPRAACWGVRGGDALARRTGARRRSRANPVPARAGSSVRAAGPTPAATAPSLVRETVHRRCRLASSSQVRGTAGCRLVIGCG